MGGYKYTASVAAAPPVDDDWTRVDVTDGSWTLNDHQSNIATAASNTGGINQVEIGTAGSNLYINGPTWHKEHLTPDGGSVDLADKPVLVQFYIHAPGCAWQDDSGNTGGDGRPAVASNCYIVAGVMTDPENLPTAGATTKRPLDIVGAGWQIQGVVNRQYRAYCRNVSNSAPYGVIDTNKAALKLVNSTDSGGGFKALNRIQWHTRITKCEQLGAGTLDPAEGPRSQYLIWADRWDAGDLRTENSVSIGQRWGRSHTDQLHVFVSVGRGTSTGSNVTIDFDVYYKITVLDGGNSPSGKTGLS